jgi:hypothetical protein
MAVDRTMALAVLIYATLVHPFERAAKMAGDRIVGWAVSGPE